MRVASRRLRAALSLFREFLPPSAAKLGDDLRWVGQTLGAVRDLDVQLEQLDGWLLELSAADREALAPVRSLLEAKRAAARETMLTALDSRRFELFVGRFGGLLRSARGRRSGPACMPARAVAPDLIDGLFRAFRKAARRIERDSPVAEYHRVRIRGKRLRYALEFLADLYPGHTGPLTKRLASLQDLLGLHQDAEVAIQRLRRLASEHSAELPGGDLRDGRDCRALPSKRSRAPNPVPRVLCARHRQGLEDIREADRNGAPCPARRSRESRVSRFGNRVKTISSVDTTARATGVAPPRDLSTSRSHTGEERVESDSTSPASVRNAQEGWHPRCGATQVGVTPGPVPLAGTRRPAGSGFIWPGPRGEPSRR
jgi:CHAD domain-containing protein